MNNAQGQTAGFADTDANQMYHLAERVAKLEATAPHSATKADINKVMEEIAKVRGEITAFKGEVKNGFTKSKGEVTNGFTKSTARMDSIDERLNRLEERLDRIEERLDRMDKRFDQQDKRFYQLAGLMLICTAVVVAHDNPQVANFLTGLIDLILR